MASANIRITLGEAVRLHQSGQLEQAAALYRKVLAIDPNNADALHLLGMVALQHGQAESAAQLIRKAIALHGREASYHFHLALALQTLNDMEGAIAFYRNALALQPDNADIYNNMGNALSSQGRRAEAIAAFRDALAHEPDNAVAHNNLGNVQRRMGLRKEAEDSFRKAIASEPTLAAALINLGDLHWETGELEKAEGLYARAASARPGDTGILENLAMLLLARGKNTEAMTLILRALSVQETPKAKKLFADAARRADWSSGDDQIRQFMVHALTAPWDRPGALSSAAGRLIRSHAAIAPLVKRAEAAWPGGLCLAALLGDEGFAPLAEDALLMALLTSAPNTDIPLERFMTLLRGAMLREITQPREGEAHLLAQVEAQSFASALAQQCFINEYIALPQEGELAAAMALRAAVETARNITPMQLLVVAAYFPLQDITNVERLLERSWPAPVEAVLTQQLREPLQELRLRAEIPRLTKIGDAVSRSVQKQYEENPYPRWIKAAPETPDTIGNFLGNKFPLAALEPPSSSTQDILIAGCGTGQRAIAMARKFGDPNMLAVDLSLASLAYARRKSAAMGLTVDYAQADILELEATGRRFDFIESLGVLHHLADPWAAWRTLLSLLRPGGVMLLGLYSEMARRPVMAARARIAERGLSGSADNIRRFRQELIQHGDQDLYASILVSEDFFSLSACRDLLFHVQEQRMTLPQIAHFLSGQNLRLLGFELDGALLAAYHQRFPEDKAAIDLACWHAFEADHPGIFGGMYVFWVQKPAPATARI